MDIYGRFYVFIVFSCMWVLIYFYLIYLWMSNNICMDRWIDLDGWMNMCVCVCIYTY